MESVTLNHWHEILDERPVVEPNGTIVIRMLKELAFRKNTESKQDYLLSRIADTDDSPEATTLLRILRDQVVGNSGSLQDLRVWMLNKKISLNVHDEGWLWSAPKTYRSGLSERSLCQIFPGIVRFKDSSVPRISLVGELPERDYMALNLANTSGASASARSGLKWFTSSGELVTFACGFDYAVASPAAAAHRDYAFLSEEATYVDVGSGYRDLEGGSNELYFPFLDGRLPFCRTAGYLWDPHMKTERVKITGFNGKSFDFETIDGMPGTIYTAGKVYKVGEIIKIRSREGVCVQEVLE